MGVGYLQREVGHFISAATETQIKRGSSWESMLGIEASRMNLRVDVPETRAIFPSGKLPQAAISIIILPSFLSFSLCLPISFSSLVFLLVTFHICILNALQSSRFMGKHVEISVSKGLYLHQPMTCQDNCYYYYYYYYLLLLSSSSSSSPLCRVFTLTYLKQTMSLDNTVLQLFCSHYSWCI